MKTVAIIALTFFATSVFAAQSNPGVENVKPIINNNTVQTPDETSDDIIIPVLPNDESVPASTNNNDQVTPPTTNDTPDDLDDIDDDSDNIDDELEDTTPNETPDNSITPPNDNKPLQF